MRKLLGLLALKNIYIPYFTLFFTGIFFAESWLNFYTTYFISFWETVKEVGGVISIVVGYQEFYESTCKQNPHTFLHGDLPERHIIGFTPGDLEIASLSAFHNICFCQRY